MGRQRRHCATCGKELSRGAKGQFCFSHLTYDRQFREKRAAAVKRFFAHNPHALAERSRKVAEANRRPERREKARAQAHERKLWELGLAAASRPEARARQGESCSRSRLAHIPLERQDDYRALVLKVGAAEALRVVMGHQNTILARGYA